jgi:hypothetical protein
MLVLVPRYYYKSHQIIPVPTEVYGSVQQQYQYDVKQTQSSSIDDDVNVIGANEVVDVHSADQCMFIARITTE